MGLAGSTLSSRIEDCWLLPTCLDLPRPDASSPVREDGAILHPSSERMELAEDGSAEASCEYGRRSTRVPQLVTWLFLKDKFEIN